jgi:hypothetical protein
VKRSMRFRGAAPALLFAAAVMVLVAACGSAAPASHRGAGDGVRHRSVFASCPLPRPARSFAAAPGALASAGVLWTRLCVYDGSRVAAVGRFQAGPLNSALNSSVRTTPGRCPSEGGMTAVVVLTYRSMSRHVVIDFGGGEPSIVTSSGTNRCLFGRAAGTMLTFLNRAGHIQAIYGSAGNPIVAGSFGDLGVGHWSLCSARASSSCTPVKSSHGVFESGPVPADTIFELTTEYRGQMFAARTVPWRGSVRATARPQLRGRVRVGATVTPIAGRWAGGWGSESDQLGVEACLTPSGRGCVMLGGGEQGCPGGRARAVVGGWFTGWYLYALDGRIARDYACAGVAYGLEADIPPWKVGPTIARSHRLARVIGPPAPTVSIRRRAVVRGGRVLVARVRCSSLCPVQLVVDESSVGQFTSHSTLTGSALVGVPGSASFGQLRPGRLQVTVNVDGGPAVSGHTRLP